MKILVVMALAFVLAGCAGLAPAAPTAAPTASPQVIVQTVVVTVVPTEKPTEIPTQTLAPTATLAPTSTPQILVVTATPGTGASSDAAGSPAPASNATATLPANAGGDLFTSLTRSSDHFALRCLPETITFQVSTSNPYVVGVDLYYRIEDQLSVSISGWVNGGSMTSDKHGNFTMDFPSSRVGPDLRSHRAWFDYQFVGTNKYGDAVGRSLRIVKQITYTIDCTD